MGKILKYLWIVLVVLLTSFGFNLRYTNDESNKSVLLVSNFDEIQKLEKELGKTKDEIAKEQKKVGISGVLMSKEDMMDNKEFLKKNKLKPLLKIDSNGDIRDYENVIKEYKVKYIWFDYDEERENRIKSGEEKGAHLSETIGYPDELDDVIRVIKDNKLIIVAKERISQISIQDTKGIKDIIKGTNYSMNRMYSMLDKQLARVNGQDIFYEIMRSIVDRGIRVVEIKQIRNPNFTLQRNYEETNLGTKELVNFISGMGYNTNKDLVSLDATELNIGYYVAMVMSALALTCAVYVKKLFNTDFKLTFIVFAMSMLALIAACPLSNIEKNLALFASILYSSLSGLIVMRMCETDSKMLMLKSILVFLGVNFLGGYVVVSCLSSLRYTMTLDLFRGVKIAFVVPLIMYIVSYVIINKVRPKDVIEYIKSKSKIGIGLAVLGVGFILAVYILRSGNFKILRASELELRLREILEYTWKVRPRTKEILIGYPMLMLLVNFRKSKNNILKFILGFGMTIGSISVINSFCHVFTPIEISMRRGVNGMVTGVFIGGGILLLLKNEKIKKILERIPGMMIFFSKLN